MSTITVKDSVALVSALKTAQSGDVIQLASGTYAPVSITGINIAGNVTIQSATASSYANLTGLNVKDSSGLTFRGLEFSVDAAKGDNQFLVMSSSRINFDGLKVHGSLDGNAQNDGAGMLIRASKDVSVTNSEFQQLRNALAHMDDDGLKISGNVFHDIRTDGIRGGGSSHVTVSNNYFTGFDPVDGDHPDAIQFWTTNTTRSATDITVTGNIVVRGAGDPIQGIFFRDQVGNLPYQNVKITDNVVVGGMYNGISVNGVQGMVISGNVVAGLPDQKSWILTTNADNVTLSSNTATEYVLDGTTHLTETGDKTIAAPTDGGKAILTAWASTHTLPTGSITLSSGGSLSAPLLSSSSSSSTSSALSAAADASVSNMELSRATVTKVAGTAGADSLKVDLSHDTYVDAGAGNDVIYGGGIGHNTMAGGGGDDTYYVKTDFERVVEKPGEGVDTVVASVDFALSANVENLRMAGTAIFGAGNELDNKITGTDLDNEIRGLGGNDQIQSLAGNDLVSGGDGNDTLQGGAGNDTVCGDAGNDKITGDEGSDLLNGGGGADTIEGGAGADTITGGAGADLFVFRDADLGTTDRITDFNRVDGDKISLVAIDANTTVAGDQKFTFIGTAAFHKVAGELHMDIANGVTTITGDVNGDGVADFTLVLPGAGTLTAADFLL